MSGILSYFHTKIHNYFNPPESFGFIDFNPLISPESETSKNYVFPLCGVMDYRKFFSDIIKGGEVDYTLFDESVKSDIYFQAVLEKIVALPNSYFYISLDPALFSISHVSNNALDADTLSPDIFTHIATIIEDEEETFWKKNHLENEEEGDHEENEEENEEEDNDGENEEEDNDGENNDGEDNEEEDNDGETEGENEEETDKENDAGENDAGDTEEEEDCCPCCGYNRKIKEKLKEEPVADLFNFISH